MHFLLREVCSAHSSFYKGIDMVKIVMILTQHPFYSYYVIEMEICRFSTFFLHISVVKRLKNAVKSSTIDFGEYTSAKAEIKQK